MGARVRDGAGAGEVSQAPGAGGQSAGPSAPSLWLRRLTAMALSGASGIHLVLTPAHFEEQFVYGVFFLVAAVFQLSVAQRLVLSSTPAAYRAGLWGSVVLVIIWVGTRVVAPPLADLPEPVDLWGVLAKALELAAMFLLLVMAPPGRRSARAGAGRPGPPRFSWGWALLAGSAFIAVFALGSGSLVYVPAALKAPSVRVDPWQGPSLLRPWVEGAVTPHLYINAPWSVLVFGTVAGLLMATATGLMVGLARCGETCSPLRRGYVSAAPAALAVPGCCGLPVAAFAGTTAMGLLFVATPWLLLAATVGLSWFVGMLLRRWRLPPADDQIAGGQPKTGMVGSTTDT